MLLVIFSFLLLASEHFFSATHNLCVFWSGLRFCRAVVKASEIGVKGVDLFFLIGTIGGMDSRVDIKEGFLTDSILVSAYRF